MSAAPRLRVDANISGIHRSVESHIDLGVLVSVTRVGFTAVNICPCSIGTLRHDFERCDPLVPVMSALDSDACDFADEAIVKLVPLTDFVSILGGPSCHRIQASTAESLTHRGTTKN